MTVVFLFPVKIRRELQRWNGVKELGFSGYGLRVAGYDNTELTDD